MSGTATSELNFQVKPIAKDNLDRECFVSRKDLSNGPDSLEPFTKTE